MLAIFITSSPKSYGCPVSSPPSFSELSLSPPFSVPSQQLPLPPNFPNSLSLSFRLLPPTTKHSPSPAGALSLSLPRLNAFLFLQTLPLTLSPNTLPPLRARSLSLSLSLPPLNAFLFLETFSLSPLVPPTIKHFPSPPLQDALSLPLSATSQRLPLPPNTLSPRCFLQQPNALPHLRARSLSDAQLLSYLALEVRSQHLTTMAGDPTDRRNPRRGTHPRYIPKRGQVLKRILKSLLLCLPPDLRTSRQIRPSPEERASRRAAS